MPLHPQIIKLLVSKQSPVDPINKAQWTPLHRAAYNGRKDAVGTLVRLGASLLAGNKDGNTALHLACYMNQLSVIEVGAGGVGGTVVLERLEQCEALKAGGNMGEA
jgi:ankyrin repeat protein